MKQDYFAEVRAIMAESHKELAEYQRKAAAELAEFRRETAERIAADEKSTAELKKALAETQKIVSGIGNNTGAVAEEYFYEALDQTKQFAGVKYDYVSRNIKNRRNRVESEFDIVMYNGTSVAIIETKYCAHPNFVAEFAEEKVVKFRTLFPEYAQHKIYLGIASFAFNEEVLKRARELGIGIIRQKGDAIECETDNIKVY